MALSAITSEDHVQGDASAVVTLLEYGDFQCPSCLTGFEIVQRLQKHFGPDKLRFVFRNFPLSMHENARPAAETAEYAAAHDKYWEMHDLLFEHQRALSVRNLVGYARQLGLPIPELETALKEGTYTDRVDRDVLSGEAARVHATPTFFINGKQAKDAYDYEALVEAIDAAAASAKG